MSVIKFIQDGGFFMYPILLIMFIGLGIAIERIMFLSRVKKANKELWDAVYPSIQKGDTEKALKAVKDNETEIGRILEYGLTRNRTAKNVEDVETAMEEALMEVMPRLEARTPFIATFANVATLLGLLGTVQGLIVAFAAIANADPAQKGDLLSSSISVAMNTTAFGLIVAIPLLLLYAFLQSRTGEVVESLEMASIKLLNALRQIRNNA
ncbi:MAG TPA: MotA/TolQ/ExbB proton channel family protein [Agitococcus sp.]|nr:MotA/TolQ/ExbB proton channel family protein [Agitococcus sp.]HNC04312.1 MotA/TolQ/ExbB proton channel family protein [Agitococcus sp.]HNE90445.1 MotA/TolQ/ExbB proton channel family protein [Agitococcus sp.]HNH43673.1 MotA/TolQ/ExbB proton channel family protein [Agitococcus sp.]HNJ87068.1 MotA/TolQ/ExbB proton channel family protein [Agitococcus sp.]